MQDILTQLNMLRRPSLLMRAARIGADEYRRDLHLGRLLNQRVPARNGAALIQLMEHEAHLNDQRLNADATYNLLRHIDLLIAIVGEARQLRQTLDAA